MLYPIIRQCLFSLEPEQAHNVALKMLQWCPQIVFPKQIYKPIECLGLTFPNRIGLAAGLDKNADYLPGLAKLGFGFIEVGTVTPKPQEGNPKPRLFRLPQHQALINRMGFNNKGVDHLVKQVQHSNYEGILGINIGKNKTTANDNAVDDYLYCLDKVYSHASYIVINISSPNTPGLRELQQKDYLQQLLAPLKQRQLQLAANSMYKPMLIKIAPDLSADECREAIEVIQALEFDGLIATNTSNSRQGVESHQYAKETGGLSGAPIREHADAVLALCRQYAGDDFPIIGLGGILSATDARIKFEQGANLLQIYTGFIYQGPQLIQDCAQI